MKVFLLGLTLLASCAPASTLMVTPMSAAIHPRVAYQVVDQLPGTMLGRAHVIGRVCLVSILKNHVDAMTVAHEVGHCLDAGRSAHFGQAGCILRPYACDPAEGFADTYALLYHLRYGNRLDVLGWPGAGETTDPLPSPDEVTPAILPILIQQLADQVNQR